MATRTMLIGLKFFAVAAALGIAFLVAGPIPAVRALGACALAAAVAGIGTLLTVLRGADPHAWMVLTFHVRTSGQRIRAAAAAAARRMRQRLAGASGAHREARVTAANR